MTNALPSPLDAVRATALDASQAYDHSEQTRTYALAVFAETNNISYAARCAGIPRQTLRNWLSDDATQSVVVQLREAIRAYTAWEYVEIAAATARQAKQRIEQGDPVVLKNGSIVYAPVKFRDLVMGMAVSTDKAILLGGTIANNQASDAILDKLAGDILSRVDKRLESERSKPSLEPLSPDLTGYLG